MAKKKCVASCPNCGRRLCVALNDSQLQIVCTCCKTVVDIEIVEGKVSVEESKVPLVLPIHNTAQ